MFRAGVKGMSERSELIPCYILILHFYILILHVSVCESGRSREGHLTRAKNLSFFSLLDLDVTYSSSLTQLASNGTSRN